MIRVLFEASPFGPEVDTRAQVGDALLDLCDRTSAPIPFSCRDASCGTCTVELLAGHDLLDPPGPSERLVLDALAAPGCRLACRARILRPGPLLHLRLAPSSPRP